MSIDFYDNMLCITEDDIIEVTDFGIKHRLGFIDFETCAKQFKKEHECGGHIVGERNGEGNIKKKYEYIFYTTPIKTRLRFIEGVKLRELFADEQTCYRFWSLENIIRQCGYSTVDFN